MAAQAARLSGDFGDPADHPATGQVRELLDQVIAIREATDGEFDLPSLAKRAELLAAAHDTLAAALED
ncbi:hypothetical protein GOHSU_02_01410 [Gordonia hirsuta DSM 44140 = NBRC 16056]|uniref:Uncharacterized protein n=2 Tax=Gordonia hirsuta TaxID=53427 RepID=L7L5J2_9ACTN|nr:hypothetical protein GOHSU_02_01410 [Gordonia hirsuta DSM 44140 = NBRC 16056]